METVRIRISGAARQDARMAAWSAIIERRGQVSELVGTVMYEKPDTDPETMKGIMKLTAAAYALGKVESPCRIDVRSDSPRIVSTMNACTLFVSGDSPEKAAWQNLARELDRIGPRRRMTWNLVTDASKDDLDRKCEKLALDALREDDAERTHRKTATAAVSDDEKRTAELSTEDLGLIRIALSELGDRYDQCCLPHAAAECFALESRLRSIQLGKD